MANLIKSFITILILSNATFWLLGKALPNYIEAKEYKSFTKAWFVVLTAAFFLHNIWLFWLFLTCYCAFFLSGSPQKRLTSYMLLFAAMPLASIEIPGLMGIRYLFKLNYPFALMIIFLVGLYFKPNSLRWLSLKTDRYVLIYFIFIAIFSFRDDTFTNGMRECLVQFFRTVVPYYVISRYLSELKALNRAMFALYLGLLPLALVGIFETLRHWHVYDPMVQALLGWNSLASYDIRSGGLRATAIFGSPISFGYVMVIIFGLLVYLQPFIHNQRFVKIMGGMIIACLFATMARGAWLGLVCLYFVFLWTGKSGVPKIVGWSLAGIFSLPILALTPFGSKFIDLLPFIGTTRSDTVDYRAQLLEQSKLVIKRNLWFGDTNFLDSPELEVMRQGQGIIDIVNSYVGLLLAHGVIGLTLFMAIFLGLLWEGYFTLKRIPPGEEDLHRLGRVLLAILISILFMIGTVSAIDYIPYFYWLFIAIMAAYLRVAQKTIKLYKAKRLSAT